MKGARQIADDHLVRRGDPNKAIDKLIATRTRLVAATGFASGVGGVLILPVTIPTDVAVFYAMSACCAAGVAHLRDCDVESEEVRSIVLINLICSAGAAVASEVGVRIGTRSGTVALRRLPWTSPHRDRQEGRLSAVYQIRLEGRHQPGQGRTARRWRRWGRGERGLDARGRWLRQKDLIGAPRDGTCDGRRTAGSACPAPVLGARRVTPEGAERAMLVGRVFEHGPGASGGRPLMPLTARSRAEDRHPAAGGQRMPRTAYVEAVRDELRWALTPPVPAVADALAGQPTAWSAAS